MRRVERGGGRPILRPCCLCPCMDIYERPEQNLVMAMLELPGVNKEDIAIDVDPQNQCLVVTGGKKVNIPMMKNMDEKNFVHRERQTGRFTRTLMIPSGVNVRFGSSLAWMNQCGISHYICWLSYKPEDVKAKFKIVVLITQLPKNKVMVTQKSVPIHQIFKN